MIHLPVLFLWINRSFFNPQTILTFMPYKSLTFVIKVNESVNEGLWGISGDRYLCCHAGRQTLSFWQGEQLWETQPMTQSQSPSPVTVPGLREISGNQQSLGNGKQAVTPIWVTAEGRIFHNTALCLMASRPEKGSQEKRSVRVN